MNTKDVKNINTASALCIDFFDAMSVITTVICAIGVVTGLILTFGNTWAFIAVLLLGPIQCVINYFCWLSLAVIIGNLQIIANKDSIEEVEPEEPQKWSERKR